MQQIGLLDGRMEAEVCSEFGWRKLKPYRRVALLRQEIQAFGHKPPEGRLFRQKVIRQIRHARLWLVGFQPFGRPNQHSTFNARIRPDLFLQGVMQPVRSYGSPAKQMVRTQVRDSHRPSSLSNFLMTSGQNPSPNTRPQIRRREYASISAKIGSGKRLFAFCVRMRANPCCFKVGGKHPA